MPKITHPLWHHDRKLVRALPIPGIVGVDEAGRGPFAGPVVAAAAFIPAETYGNKHFKKLTIGLDDSKKLTPEQREGYFQQLEAWAAEGLLSLAHAEGSIEDIETLNILGATRLAMEKSLNALNLDLVPHGGFDPLFAPEANSAQYPPVLVDGKPLKPFPFAHTAIVKGDGKSLAIAAASIVAKVTRDRLMLQFAKKYPHYAFESNKGYGTAKHCAAILEKGPCPIHRPSFLKKLFAQHPAQAEQVSLPI